MALIPLKPNRTLDGISTFGIKLTPLNPQRGISTISTTIPQIENKPLAQYEKTPETYESPKETIAKKTAFLQPKEGENIVMKGLKFFGNMIVSAFTPLIQNVTEIHALNEISKGVAEGKYDPAILDEFESLKKSSPQVVGDVAQSVLMLTPLKALNAIKGLPVLSKIAMKIMATTGAKIGGAFGVAGALSEEPEVKLTEIIKGGVAGAVGGAVAMPVLGVVQRGISAGVSKMLGKIIKPKVPAVKPKVAEPTTIEKIFPKLYEKRIIKQGLLKSTDIAKEPPHLSTVQELLKPASPVRTVLAKDPQASYIGLKLRGAVQKQNNLYQSLYGKDWQVIKKIPKDTFSKIVGLQEKGIKIAEAPKELQAGLTALRGLEKKSFELSKQAGAKISEWRFTTENHFSRVWTGSQVILDKTNNKILAFAENRVQGIQKLLQLSSEKPKLNLVMKPRTELYVGKTMPTGLSQKGYFKFINQIADVMGVTPDEALQEVSMQGIARINPPKTKIGQWLFRKGELGDYTTDPTKIYPSLWNKLTKKIYIDPEVRSAALRLNKIADTSIRKSASDLIDAVTGKYQKQVLPYSVTGLITGTQGQLKLGARVSPAIVNTFQRLYGISVTGEKNFLRATKNIFTKKGQAILDKIGVSTEVPLYEGMGRTRQAKWYNPLYLFGKTEGGKYIGNRNSVALASYYKGLELPFEKINANFKKLGLPQWKSAEDLAVSFARNVVDATQFRYDVSDFAPLIRNNLGKVLFQFKTYGLNIIANTANVLKGKPLAGLELYYPEGLTKPQALHQAIVHFGTLLSQGGIKALGWGTERFLPAATITWLAIKAPALLYGITAFLGLDISSSATVELSNMLSILPYSDAQNVAKAIKTKNPEMLLAISPAALRIYKALDAMENGMWLRDLESKQNIIKLKPLELVEFALGVNPLAVTQESTIHYANVKRSKELSEMVSNAKRDIMIAIENKDVELASNIVTNLKLQGIELKASDFEEYVKSAELPRLLRDFQNARKSERGRIAEEIINLYK